MKNYALLIFEIRGVNSNNNKNDSTNQTSTNIWQPHVEKSKKKNNTIFPPHTYTLMDGWIHSNKYIWEKRENEFSFSSMRWKCFSHQQHPQHLYDIGQNSSHTNAKRSNTTLTKINGARVFLNIIYIFFLHFTYIDIHYQKNKKIKKKKSYSS